MLGVLAARATSDSTYEAPGVKVAHVPKGRRSAAPASFSGSRLAASFLDQVAERTPHQTRIEAGEAPGNSSVPSHPTHSTGDGLALAGVQLSPGSAEGRSHWNQRLCSSRPVERVSNQSRLVAGRVVLRTLGCVLEAHAFRRRVHVSSVLDGPSYTPGSRRSAGLRSLRGSAPDRRLASASA